MDKTELKRIAAAHGLARLDDKQLELLAASLKSNAELAGRLPKSVHWTDEPAHVFRLPLPKETGR